MLTKIPVSLKGWTMTDSQQAASSLAIPSLGTLEAYVIYVDLNGFTQMVANSESRQSGMIAQFTRDCLLGIVKAIEVEGGEIVGFMGDAVLGIIQDSESVVCACFGIAKNVDRQCEYVSEIQQSHKDAWPFCPGGPSFKIAIEYGTLDISTIWSRFLGEQRLFIGGAINYAARISAAARGLNRCVIGPAAAKMAFSSYDLDGPQQVDGKSGESSYDFFIFPMGDIWIEDPRSEDTSTFWG